MLSVGHVYIHKEACRSSALCYKMIVIVNAGLPGAQIVVLTLKAKGLSDSASIVAKVYLPSYLLSIITIAGWTSLGLVISREGGTSFCKR